MTKLSWLPLQFSPFQSICTLKLTISLTDWSPNKALLYTPRQLYTNYSLSASISLRLANYFCIMLTFLSLSSVDTSSMNSSVLMSTVLNEVKLLIGSILLLGYARVSWPTYFVMNSVMFYLSYSALGPQLYTVTGLSDWYRFEWMHYWRNSKDSLAMSSCFNGSQLS